MLLMNYQVKRIVLLLSIWDDYLQLFYLKLKDIDKMIVYHFLLCFLLHFFVLSLNLDD